MTSITLAAGRRTGISVSARRAVLGGFTGFFVDMFDIYLPIIVLGPAIVYFEPSALSATAKSVLAGTVFAATMLGRPVGAAVFGHLADHIGRKRVTVTSLVGFGAATVLMAALPGYGQWGIAGIIALIVLRFIDGFFLGGEYTAAIPLAMELVPKRLRGLYGGLMQASYLAAFVCISLITLGLLNALPAAGVDSPYVQWSSRRSTPTCRPHSAG
jgi:MFS family permease